MKKKLLSLFAGASLLVPTLSLAVGLGSVRTYSNLNEKLKAEIPVLSVKKRGKMTVSLASNAEFAKRGVQRSDILNSLSFSLGERNGRYYVRVSSKEQIAVPYLNFILRLNTPEGVVSREYAIFLDPASRSTSKKSINKKSVSASPYRSARKTNKQVVPKRKVTSPSSGTKVANARGGRYGPIRRGETLWSIASHTRPSANVSVREMMNAIKRANPRTLSKGLPAGVTINIPTIKGYAAYSGGYAPMPVAAKKVKAKASKNAVAKKVKKTKNVKQSATKTANKIETVKVHKAELTQKPEEVARPHIVKEKATQAEQEPVKNEEQLVQVFPEGKDTATQTGKLVQQLTDESKKLATEAIEEVDTASNTISDVGKEALDTVGEKLKNTGEGISNATETVVEKTKVAVKNTVEKTDGLVNDAGQLVDNAINSTQEPVMPAAPKAVDSAKVLPQKTVIKAPKPTVKPAIKTQPKEASLMDKVIDFAPYVGGGTAIAGLAGFLLWNRRKKSEKAVAPLTEADMAELMGEDDIDKLQSLEDDLVEHVDDIDDDFILDDSTHHLEASNAENVDDVFADLDDSVVDDQLTEEDDLFADFNELAENNEDGQAAEVNLLTEENDIFDDLNDAADKSAVAEIELHDDLDDELFADLGDITDSVVPTGDDVLPDLEETVKDKVDDFQELDEDLGLSFDLDDEASEDLFKPIDLEKNNLDLEASDDFDFDLTDGDDTEDLLALDNLDLDEVAEVELTDNTLDFNLDEINDDVADKVSDVKQSTIDKTESISLALSDEVNGAKDFILEEKNDFSTSLDLNETDIDTILAEDKTDIGLSSPALNDEILISKESATESVSPEVVSRMRMKMDLANSFISIGENKRAKEILTEIIENGSVEQVVKAKELLGNLV